MLNEVSLDMAGGNVRTERELWFAADITMRYRNHAAWSWKSRGIGVSRRFGVACQYSRSVIYMQCVVFCLSTDLTRVGLMSCDEAERRERRVEAEEAKRWMLASTRLITQHQSDPIMSLEQTCHTHNVSTPSKQFIIISPGVKGKQHLLQINETKFVVIFFPMWS